MRRLSKVGGMYGAPMGRPSDTLSGKVTIQRVIIIDGYDRGGAYWGMGAPLYWAYDNDGEVWLRARSTDAAKAELRQRFPEITFKK